MRHAVLFACLLLLVCRHAAAAPCAGLAAFNADTPDTWAGWGGGHANARANLSASNPIDAASLGGLKLKWAYGFEGVHSVIGNPALFGSSIFIGDENGKFYALDRESGCEHWVFQADNGVRTAPSVARIDGRWTVFFGDRGANVYAVDAVTGRQLWKTKVDEHRAAILTGAPQFVHLDSDSSPDRLIVPVSSSEEGLGAVPTYPCCSFQGSVVSLDAADGKIVWKTHTIQKPVRETGDGKFGPSGAAIWSAPTIDPAMNRLYVTTGDAYSPPADMATDAVIAIDLSSGEILWVNQGTAGDIWTVVCMTPNAFDDCGPDQDFGSPAMLVTPDNGKPFLVAGQKSGIVRAYDRATGNTLWQTALVENTTAFGGKIVWGGAGDSRNAYFGMGNNTVAAVALGDGAVRWTRELPPAAGMEAHGGREGPVTVSKDILFSGSWDGMLRALATGSGEVLWEFNTARSFDTVNDVPANGGSLGAVGQVVENGLLLVPSGYVGVKNGMPGNVLLVFELPNR